MRENQRNQEKAEISPVDIAAHGKTEKEAEGRQREGEKSPERAVFFVLSTISVGLVQNMFNKFAR